MEVSGDSAARTPTFAAVPASCLSSFGGSWTMSETPFQSFDVAHLRRALAKVHEQVADGHRRVELTRPDCDDVCVILSKAELESLERALEILSETAEYKAM